MLIDGEGKMSQSLVTQTARERLTEKAITKKMDENLSWEQIAEGTSLNVAFVTAAILGQHALPPEAAEKVGKRLGLSEPEISLLEAIPLRGSLGASIPSDPTIYRFYEIVQVYGTTLKALIHERFGDGIISAINFKLNVEKIADPEGGHRAVITLDGKYLPTKPF
jgi:cyanate lyase